ncbi:TetR/AcrR family transcriptional regulator [Hymenobacter psoromatis]|uniref:TetR/AcrR family transcriptional regulator n=1 Tax=Hymenobacter psoromatis TaxID=1484116 RepID=UPI001CC139E4|nr:TetR/AcrR family transcriptional regulator [Hymenobacter psoromatis]
MTDTSKLSTEQLILEAAQAVFLEKGLAGARMQEIADRAGINKALLHYYFRSKEKLSETVVHQTLGLLVPRLWLVLEAEEELFGKIRRLAQEYVEFLQAHPLLPLFIVNELNRNPRFFAGLVAGNEPGGRLASFRRQVEAAEAQGHIRPVGTAQLLLNIVSMLIFPFLGRPLFQAVLGLSAAEMQAELAKRQHAVAEFVIQAITP